MSKELLVSIDTETGGFNCELNALLTLGVFVAETETGTVIFRKEFKFSNYVEVVEKTPTNTEIDSGAIYVEKSALDVNKIDLEDLSSNGTTLESVDFELAEYFNKLDTNKEYRLIPLGQNLKFDLGFIEQNLPMFYSFLMGCRYHRELSTASSLWHTFKKMGYNKSVSLDAMRKEMGIVSSGQTHSSLVDAEDNFKIYTRILKDLTQT